MRYQPTELGQHISRYFRDTSLSNYNILYYDDTDSAAQYNVCKFIFYSSNVTVYKGYQI